MCVWSWNWKLVHRPYKTGKNQMIASSSCGSNQLSWQYWAMVWIPAENLELSPTCLIFILSSVSVNKEISCTIRVSGKANIFLGIFFFLPNGMLIGKKLNISLQCRHSVQMHLCSQGRSPAVKEIPFQTERVAIHFRRSKLGALTGKRFFFCSHVQYGSIDLTTGGSLFIWRHRSFLFWELWVALAKWQATAWLMNKAQRGACDNLWWL